MFIQIMKKLLFFSLFWVVVAACNGNAHTTDTGNSQPADGNQTDDLVIKGKVRYPMNKSKVVLSKVAGNKLTPVDSVALDKNNMFTFHIKNQEPEFYVLNFYNTQQILLVVDSKPITLEVDGNKPTGATQLKGTPAVEDMQKLNDWLSAAQIRMGDLQKEMQAASTSKSEAGRKAVEKKRIAFQQQNTKEFKALVGQMQPTLTIWYALNNGVLDPQEEFAFMMPLIEKLQKALPKSHYKPDFDTFADQLTELSKALKVGDEAPEIALSNPEGKQIKLSSLRGKYVLIDFWASWCGPCRQENPNVVRVYNQYKDKNFEIYGVSLDREQAKWVQAIQQDNLTWTHVSDLKFWSSEAAKTYNVRGIPATFLLDPKGKIIAKNLRGEALESKLMELLGTKQ